MSILPFTTPSGADPYGNPAVMVQKAPLVIIAVEPWECALGQGPTGDH